MQLLSRLPLTQGAIHKLKRFVDSAVQSSLQIAQPVCLDGRTGTVIENNGFGGIVIRLAGGAVIHLQEIQWREELEIEITDGVLAHERNKTSATNRQDAREPGVKLHEGKL